MPATPPPNAQPTSKPASAPSPTSPSADVLIVGGGVIGLAIARRLAGAGLSVTVLDRGRPGREASYAAAGMLCPGLEARPGDPLYELGRAALALYPGFASELESETGLRLDLRLDGVIQPLGPDEDTAETSPGARIVGREDLRALEPALSPRIERAVFHPGEGSIDNRALVDALLSSCRRRGAAVLGGHTVTRITGGPGKVEGVETERGAFRAPVVVNAAGAWAGRIPAPAPPLEVTPVKGQIVLLDRSVPGAPGLGHVLYGRRAYLVPRSDGRVIGGATVEEKGFDKTVDVEGVTTLLTGAIELVPGLVRAAFRDAWAGLRPRPGSGGPPVVGPWGAEGYFIAAGHYREGILLAPHTAEVIAGAVLAGRRGGSTG